jgi:hypothetical protein
VSNRRKPKRQARLSKMIKQEAIERLDLPASEKTVIKRVPATIHWGMVKDIDREDSEVIGETVIYEDGSYDVVVADDISDNAKTLIYGFNDITGIFSVDKDAEPSLAWRDRPLHEKGARPPTRTDCLPRDAPVPRCR